MTFSKSSKDHLVSIAAWYRTQAFRPEMNYVKICRGYLYFPGGTLILGSDSVYRTKDVMHIFTEYPYALEISDEKPSDYLVACGEYWDTSGELKVAIISGTRSIWGFTSVYVDAWTVFIGPEQIVWNIP